MTLTLNPLGHFSLPHGRQAVATGTPAELVTLAHFGWGASAMCVDRGDLWVSGHPMGDLVAKVGPMTVQRYDGEVVKVTEPFRVLTPPEDLAAANLTTLVGLAVHDLQLCGLWQHHYQMGGQDGGRKSFWNGEELVQLGDGRIKRTSGYLAEHNGKLYCGRSSGAGSGEIHEGPLLYQIQEPYGSTGYTYVQELVHKRDDWTRDDKYTAAAITGRHALFAVRKAIWSDVWNAYPVWYGKPDMPDQRPEWFTSLAAGRDYNGWRDEDDWRRAWTEHGLVDRYDNGKGYHALERQVWLLPYTWPDGQPLEPIVLPEFHPSCQVRGMAYDPDRRRLYVAELWPPERESSVYPGDQPRIHVYGVDEDDGPVEPPEEPGRQKIEIRLAGRLLRGEVEEVQE